MVVMRAKTRPISASFLLSKIQLVQLCFPAFLEGRAGTFSERRRKCIKWGTIRFCTQELLRRKVLFSILLILFHVSASRTRSAPRLSKFVFAPTLPRFSAPPSLFSTPNCTFFSGRNKCQFAAHKHSRSNLCTATMLDRGQESQSDVSFFPGSGAKVVSRPPQRQLLLVVVGYLTVRK